jgi:hypothetical protein
MPRLPEGTRRFSKRMSIATVALIFGEAPSILKVRRPAVYVVFLMTRHFSCQAPPMRQND